MEFDELDARSRELDRLVSDSPELDHFCSSSAWVLPARTAFAPQAQPLVAQGEAGIAAMMVLPIAGGARAGLALEASWMLASPFASPRPEELIAELLAALRVPPRRVDVLLVSGVAPGSRALQALERGGRRPPVGFAPPTERVVASLAGGIDGFLGRRSAKLRGSLRRARRAAAERGMRWERHVRLDEAAVTSVLDRIFAVEGRSWKAAQGAGMNDGPMESFYRLMLPRLAARDALRVVFLTLAGQDVAFCFGGLIAAEGRIVYRGLQASYDDEHRALSVGALSHLEMIELLCDEGVAAYDLGTEMEYKRRWGEPGLTTIGVAVVV